MIDVFLIGQGDTLPYYRIEVRDKDGVKSLSDVVSTTFRMQRISTASVVVSAIAFITDTLNGLAEHRWAVADTASTGEYAISFQFDQVAGSFSLPRGDMAKVVVEDRFVVTE